MRSKGDDCFYEKHHIIPRCIGGTDEPCNIALLKPREHRLAHKLLLFIFPENSKLIFAANMMYAGRTGECPNWLRQNISEARTASWADPSIRMRHIAAIKKGWENVERRAKQGLRTSGFWSNTENKENLRSKLKNHWANSDHEITTKILSKEQEELIYKKHQAGGSVLSLSKEFGVSRRTINDAILNVSGGAMKPKVISQEEINLAVRLRKEDGLSWSELAFMIGKNSSTIRRHVIRNLA